MYPFCSVSVGGSIGSCDATATQIRLPWVFGFVKLTEVPVVACDQALLLWTTVGAAHPAEQRTRRTVTAFRQTAARYDNRLLSFNTVSREPRNIGPRQETRIPL